ncbi:Ank1 [Symbiodinium necroappetens]|uniref:Ank1 protein n=1 Tax=Symbiodinium necroappetens TaxID=1628268 RepID=A0A813CRP5_9DINO|nr:Ank1 [Symbiodinium necroappetens]
MNCFFPFRAEEAQTRSAAVPSFVQTLYQQSLQWISHPQHWLWLIVGVSVITLAPVGILHCRDACLGKPEESNLQWEEAILGLSEAEACSLRLLELISGIYVTITYFAGGLWWFGGMLAFVKLFSVLSFVVALVAKRGSPQDFVTFCLTGLLGAVVSSLIQLHALAFETFPESKHWLLCMAFVLQLGFAAAATNSAFCVSVPCLRDGESQAEPLLPRKALWLWRTADMASWVIFWVVACMDLDPQARPCIPVIFLCELAARALYCRRCLQTSFDEHSIQLRADDQKVLVLVLCLCGMPWPCFPVDLLAQLRLQLCAMLWRSNLVIFFSIMVVHRYASVTQGVCPLATEPVLETLMGVGLTMHLLAMLVVLIYQALLRTRCMCLFPTRAVFGDSRLHLAVGLGAEHLVQEFWTADEEGSDRDRSLLLEAVFAGHGGVIEVLHAQGVDVCTAETQSGLALHVAAEAGKVDVLRALQALGADFSATDIFGSNAALLASEGGHGAALQLLLQARCDPEARNPGGNSAVIVATRNGSAALLPMLLDTRCDPQTAGRDGEPLILTAAALQTTDSLQALLEARCDPRIASKDGDTPVLRAASRGSVGVLKLLLEVRCDPSIADKRGNTVIIAAATEGCTDKLKLLLHARCDPTLTNKKGGSAVSSAVTYDRIDCLALLLAARCDPSIADKSGDTPIITAAGYDSIDALKLLLEANGDPKMINNDGSSAIIKATGVAALKLLLEARCDPSFVDKNGETPAIVAARRASTDALELLLEAKCDPKIVNKDGGSAVLEAAALQSADALKMLLEARCDPSMADKAGNTPVIIAAGNVDALKLLLEARANPRSANMDGSGAIIRAAAAGSVDSLELLLEARCDPGMADKAGNTPIITAAGMGHTDVVKLLLEARGDPKILNKHGQSAVFEAAKSRGADAELLELLLEARCDPHSVDEDGFTAVMPAAGNGAVDVLKLLLEARCDAESAEYRFGFTPVVFAAMGGSVHVLKILLSARCDPHKPASRAMFCESAATLAAGRGNTEVLRTLLSARCDPEVVNISGHTAAMLAVQEGHPKTLQFLVHEGCDLKARNKDCDTAVSLAKAAGEVGMLRLLLEARCELDPRAAGGKNSVDEASRMTDLAVEWLLGREDLLGFFGRDVGFLGQDAGRLTFSSTQALTLAYHRRKLAEMLIFSGALPTLRGQLRGLTVLLPKDFVPSKRLGCHGGPSNLLTCGVPEVARGSGKLYHEVELLSTVHFAAELGWLTTRFDSGAKTDGFDLPKSVGTDAEGWAFDAQRAAQFHNKRAKEANMDRWHPNDRLGLAIDLDEGTMRISHRDGTWRKEAGNDPKP